MVGIILFLFAIHHLKQLQIRKWRPLRAQIRKTNKIVIYRTRRSRDRPKTLNGHVMPIPTVRHEIRAGIVYTYSHELKNLIVVNVFKGRPNG